MFYLVGFGGDSKSSGVDSRLEINMDKYAPKKEEEYQEDSGIEKGLVNKFDASRHVGDGSGHVDTLYGKKLEDILPYSHNILYCKVHHVNHCVDYQLIDVSFDGFVSLMTDNGGTKDDLRLPADGDNLLEQIQNKLAEGKDLVVSVMMSATGEEQICAVRDVGLWTKFWSKSNSGDNGASKSCGVCL